MEQPAAASREPEQPAAAVSAVMTPAQALAKLAEGESLSEAEAEAVMAAIMRGEATPAQIGALLMALRVRGETIAELTGFARAMRAAALPVAVGRRPLLDTCGTGGDGSHTFNVSTVAALVVAAAGVPVAKHGNRAASSRSGSADLLEALGVPIDDDPQRVAASIERYGFGFLFAQRVHSSMRHAAGPRRELGIRTVFNLLGPLTNPAAPERQLLGVFDSRWVRPLTEVLARLGLDRAMVVHGAGGLDEVSLAGPTEVGLVDGGMVSFGTIMPEDLGLPRYPVSAFAGGDAQTNAAICRAILAGEEGPYTDLVLANAATALFAARAVEDLPAGVETARAAIRDGRALNLLHRLAEAGRRGQSA